MRRLLLIALTAAAPAAMVEDLPIPPIPPDQIRPAEIAPVPNIDARQPFTAEPSSPGIDVKVYHAGIPDPGLGFAPGSRYQSSVDRKPIQTPGLIFTVPLQ
jgi:hypothetical protein